jgi:O-antigen ligase
MISEPTANTPRAAAARRAVPRTAWLALAWPLAALVMLRPDLWAPATVAGGMLVAAVSLRAGVLLWIATAGTFMVPLYTIRNSAVYFSTAYLSALLLLWVAGMLWRWRWRPESSRLRLPLLCVAAVAILSCAQGVAFYDPSVPGVHRFVLVQIYATALVVLSAGAALLVGSQLASVAALRWMFGILIGLGAALLLGLIIPIPFVRAPQWWQILVAHTVSLLYAMLLCNPPRAFWQRTLIAGVVVYGLVYIVVLPLLLPQAQWLSGWLMLTVPLVFATFVIFRRAVLFLLLPALPVILLFSFPLLRKVAAIAQSEGDFLRLYIWQDALQLMLVRPVLGVGPGNYLDYAMRYSQGGAPLFGSAHGNYQQAVAEMGLLGLAAVVWVLARAMALAWRLFSSVEDPFLRAFVLGVMSSLAGQAVASLVGDYLIPAYHNAGHTNICSTVYIWVMIGALMAIERVAANAGGVRAATP